MAGGVRCKPCACHSLYLHFASQTEYEYELPGDLVKMGNFDFNIY